MSLSVFGGVPPVPLLSVCVLRWCAMVVLWIRRCVFVRVHSSFFGFLLLVSVFRWRAMVVLGFRLFVFVHV